MKKLLIFGLVGLFVFLIYLCNLDRKVYYLALGDSLANGQGSDGEIILGYSDYVSDYLSSKNLLETYVDEFACNGLRITDLINRIDDNYKAQVSGKTVTLQNALIKADLVTVSIGANDIINKINASVSDDIIYDYIDGLADDLDELFVLMRQYCKEDIVLVGYYNPFLSLNSDYVNDVFSYLNDKYKTVSEENDVIFVPIDNLFRENPQFLPNDDIHPSSDGYKAISGEIIGVINENLLGS